MMATPARRIDTLQTIELAEGVEIHLRAAGPYLRFLAWFIDLLSKGALIAVYALLVGMTGPVLEVMSPPGFSSWDTF